MSEQGRGRGAWQDEKENAVGLIAWRTGRYHKEAKQFLNARLGPDVAGEGMTFEAKLERLADVVAEIFDEQGAFVEPQATWAERSTYAAYRAQFIATSKRAA
jgi:hypothetical protein